MSDDAAQPTMLVLARESRSMTQAEVAARMTKLAGGTPISQGYVSKAEAGRVSVTGQRLDLYARALGYPVSVLCSDPEVHGVGVGLVHHRKRASLGAPTLRRIHAELTLARMQVRALFREAGRSHKHHFWRIEVDEYNTPAEAAIEVRTKWGLPKGPVKNVVRLIEEAGGIVLVRDLQTRELDAVTQWTDDEAPLFLLNKTAPPDRFRWSLGHELGHVFLHQEPGATPVQERQADEFSSEFLMPAVDIAAELKHGLDLNRLRNLKHRWGVSMAALARRAATLALISDWQYRDLMVQMSALGYRTQEPGDLEPEYPCVVFNVVTELSAHEHTVENLAAVAGLLVEEFELYLHPNPYGPR